MCSKWMAILIPLVVLLSACNQSVALPTRAPTAVVPTQPPPTLTPLTLPTLANSQPMATSTPSATVVVPAKSPTPIAQAEVNITSPTEGTELVLGSEAPVSGLAQIAMGQSLTITLVSATGHLLAAVPAAASSVNSWQTTVSIPHAVTGPAELRASIYDADGNLVAGDAQSVRLALDTESSDRYLALFRPNQGQDTVAGYNLFFDGLVQRPVNNVITISLWGEGCQVRVARQDFVLRGSGYWQGFLIVPRDLTGAACAVASFGTPGEEGWREGQLEVNVLPAGDERALGVLVGNPPPESSIRPGRSLLLYGTAYNAPEQLVKISVLLENGRVLNEGVAAADLFGYWELELFIPADAAGQALIEASIGDEAGEVYAQSQHIVTIETSP